MTQHARYARPTRDARCPTPTFLHRCARSPRRDRLQRPSGALRVRLDVRVVPDLAHTKNGNWVRKIRQRDELNDARLTQAQGLDQFGHGHDGRLLIHAPTLHN